jgi:hypothetical protein
MRLSKPRPKCDIYLRILKKVKTRDYKIVLVYGPPQLEWI